MYIWRCSTPYLECRSLFAIELLIIGLFCGKYVWRCSTPYCYIAMDERWGAGVETPKNVRGEIGGWGRVPFNEPYAPS